MNAIQCMAYAEFYLDITRNGRFFFSDYNKAFGSAIQNYMDDRIGSELQRDPRNFQWIQQIRDELYPLLKVATSAPTNGTVITNRYYSVTPSHINFPTDYYDFVGLDVLIDGFTDYSRPTDYNDKGPLLKNSFEHPTNIKTYYNEDNLGLVIWRGVGGIFTSASLEYIRAPLDFSVGSEDQLLGPGVTLTNGVSYIAVDISVQNAVTYQIGTQFVAVGTTLTSGSVIAAANTQTIELPDKTHSDICKIAAQIMLKVTSNYQAAAAVQSEV